MDRDAGNKSLSPPVNTGVPLPLPTVVDKSGEPSHYPLDKGGGGAGGFVNKKGEQYYIYFIQESK